MAPHTRIYACMLYVSACEYKYLRVYIHARIYIERLQAHKLIDFALNRMDLFGEKKKKKSGISLIGL